MKTRIKKEINWYDFKEKYTPQYKNWLWFWCDFYFYEPVWCEMSTWRYCFDTLDEAKELINKERWKQCTSTSYIDY